MLLDVPASAWSCMRGLGMPLHHALLMRESPAREAPDSFLGMMACHGFLCGSHVCMHESDLGVAGGVPTAPAPLAGVQEPAKPLCGSLTALDDAMWQGPEEGFPAMLAPLARLEELACEGCSGLGARPFAGVERLGSLRSCSLSRSLRVGDDTCRSLVALQQVRWGSHPTSLDGTCSSTSAVPSCHCPAALGGFQRLQVL